MKLEQPSQPGEPLEPPFSATVILRLEEWTGEGLARGRLAAPVADRLAEGAAIDVLGGIPGEMVEVELQWPAIWRARQRRRPRPPIVRLRRVLIPAAERVAAPCLVFGDCGGCRLQQLSYTAQLAWKRDRVRIALADQGLDLSVVRDALGMDDPWGFRNQMRFTIDREGRPGLTALGTHRVIPLASCPIAHPYINATLAVLRQFPNPRPQALIRCGHHTGEVLVQPAVAGERQAALAEAGIDPRSDGLREALHGQIFQMRPSSFFQTNTLQAEVMADLVLAQMPAGPEALVVDAYCGVGTFAALLARRAGRVIGIEESASAVRDARENLARLGLEGVQILQGKTEDLLPQIPGTIDAVVLDPPRMGCAPPVMAALLARRVARIVYVSCDPMTLARDLARFQTGYRVTSVQPLDMFPQTYHIECVAVLECLDKMPGSCGAPGPLNQCSYS